MSVYSGTSRSSRFPKFHIEVEEEKEPEVLAPASDFTRIGYTKRNAVSHTPDSRHFQYVPHLPVQQKPVPTFQRLINQGNRFHLLPELDPNTVFKRGGESLPGGTIDTMTETTTSGDSQNSVDLGITVLEDIIARLKALRERMSECVVDPETAKAFGLMPYDEYLHGGKMEFESAIIKDKNKSKRNYKKY